MAAWAAACRAGSGVWPTMSIMSHTVTAEIVARVQSLEVEVGDRVHSADPVVVLDSMKMEIPVLAEVDGTVVEVTVAVGDQVHDGDPLVVVEPS